jgi:hypothetical protein
MAGSAGTVMTVLADCVGVVAVMVAVPGPTAVTNPVDTTVATAVLLDVHVIVPRALRTLSWMLLPTSTEAEGMEASSTGAVGGSPPPPHDHAIVASIAVPKMRAHRARDRNRISHVHVLACGRPFSAARTHRHVSFVRNG